MLIAVIFVLVRFPFLDEPFERDEGGYAYMGWRIAEGEVMYRDLWELMPPGLPFFYAFIFKMYGVNFFTVKFAAVLWGLIGLLFLYLLAEKLWGRQTAFCSAFLYAVFSGLPLIQGASCNTEPVMLVFLISSIYFFLLAERRERVFYLVLAGIAGGTAIFIKQAAWLNLAALGVYLLFRFRIRRLLILSFGVLLAGVPWAIYFTRYRIWPDFIYTYFTWHFTQGQSFLSADFFTRLSRSLQYLMRENSLLWLLALMAIIAILINKRSRENILIVLWGLFSFLGVCLGGAFYPHYYIQVMPALCLLSGWGLWQIIAGIAGRDYWRRAANVFSLTVIIVLAVFIFIFEYRFFFIYTPAEVNAAKYNTQMFVAARALGRYLKKQTAENDYIFVWGIEPEIYFYARRKCPTRFIHNYSIRGDDQFSRAGRQEVLREIIAKKPAYIVVAYTLSNFPELEEYLNAEYLEGQYQGMILWQRER